MGLVKANALIGANRDDLHEVEFLVDTSSLYTFLTPELASSLGIDLPLTSTVILADQRTKEVPVGVAYKKPVVRCWPRKKLYLRLHLG